MIAQASRRRDCGAWPVNIAIHQTIQRAVRIVGLGFANWLPVFPAARQVGGERIIGTVCAVVCQ